MKGIRYKTFSLRTHKKNWQLKRANVCQFELTFRCDLHCRHCYTDCYNKPAYFQKELNTKEVKFILDKAYKAGVIWLCFTGGDPLTRADFLDIYSYAKEKGFITTIFTNGFSMTEEIANYLKKRPPFAIELTLNAVTKGLYENISQVKGSFEKAMQGINLILKARQPLKIKTQVTGDNLKELPEIKRFIEGLGLTFKPSPELHARLDGDLTPCALRISPEEALSLNGRAKPDCRNENNGVKRFIRQNDYLFRCAIGSGDGINIDPYGNTFSCNLIRKPNFNLLKVDITDARNKLLPLVRNKIFISNSRCKGCKIREICNWCPGRAYVEAGGMEEPIEYYCELAKQNTKGI
jgi:radical SAM protein with 4Fe4S-binding SPASM domain